MARVQNDSAESLCDIISQYELWAKSTLGSAESFKFVEIDNGHRIVKYASLLLAEIEAQHPLGEYVIQVVQGFSARNGYREADRLLYLICRFYRAARHLLDMGVPSEKVIVELRHAIQNSTQHVRQLAVPRETCLERFLKNTSARLNIDCKDVLIKGTSLEKAVTVQQSELSRNNPVSLQDLDTEFQDIPVSDEQLRKELCVTDRSQASSVNEEKKGCEFNKGLDSMEISNLGRSLQDDNVIESGTSKTSKNLKDKIEENDMDNFKDSASSTNFVEDGEIIHLKMAQMKTDIVEDDLSWYFSDGDNSSVDVAEDKTFQNEEQHSGTDPFSEKTETSKHSRSVDFESDKDSGCVEQDEDDIINSLKELQEAIVKDIEGIKIRSHAIQSKFFVQKPNVDDSGEEGFDSDSDFESCIGQPQTKPESFQTVIPKVESKAKTAESKDADEFKEIQLKFTDHSILDDNDYFKSNKGIDTSEVKDGVKDIKVNAVEPVNMSEEMRMSLNSGNEITRKEFLFRNTSETNSISLTNINNLLSEITNKKVKSPAVNSSKLYSRHLATVDSGNIHETRVPADLAVSSMDIEKSASNQKQETTCSTDNMVKTNPVYSESIITTNGILASSVDLTSTDLTVKATDVFKKSKEADNLIHPVISSKDNQENAGRKLPNVFSNKSMAQLKSDSMSKSSLSLMSMNASTQSDKVTKRKNIMLRSRHMNDSETGENKGSGGTAMDSPTDAEYKNYTTSSAQTNRITNSNVTNHAQIINKPNSDSFGCEDDQMVQKGINFVMDSGSSFKNIPEMKFENGIKRDLSLGTGLSYNDAVNEDPRHKSVKEIVKGVLGRANSDVVEVITTLICMQSLDQTLRINPCVLQCYSMHGKKSRPEAIKGVVVKTLLENMMKIYSQPNCRYRALLVNGDLASSFSHKGYKPLKCERVITSSADLSNHQTKSSMWLDAMVDKLTELNVNLLLVKGVVSESALAACGNASVMVISPIPYKVLEQISEAAHVDMLIYVCLATENNLCEGITLSPWQQDWCERKYLEPRVQTEVVLCVEDTVMQTVVISELTSDLADLREQEFRSCLYQMANFLQSHSVVMSSGGVEDICAKFCTQQRDICLQTEEEHLSHLIYQALTPCFEDLRSILESTRNMKMAILEGFNVTKELLRTAFETVFVLLNTGAYVITGLTENDGPSTF